MNISDVWLAKICKLRGYLYLLLALDGLAFLPAIGGPMAVETPRANVNSPKALVNFSRPSRSQIMIDVSEIYAAENKTKIVNK